MSETEKQLRIENEFLRQELKSMREAHEVAMNAGNIYATRCEALNKMLVETCSYLSEIK